MLARFIGNTYFFHINKIYSWICKIADIKGCDKGSTYYGDNPIKKRPDDKTG